MSVMFSGISAPTLGRKPTFRNDLPQAPGLMPHQTRRLQFGEEEPTVAPTPAQGSGNLRAAVQATGVVCTLAAVAVSTLAIFGIGNDAEASSSSGSIVGGKLHTEIRSQRLGDDGILVVYQGPPINGKEWAYILKQARHWSPTGEEIFYPSKKDQYLLAQVDRVTEKVEFVLKNGEAPES